MPSPSTKLPATVSGTPGSYRNQGNTVSKVGDGDLSTYFDGPTPNGNVVVLDLGSAQSITSLAYAPRPNYASRMVGGVVQAATEPTFAAPLVLTTITTAPAAGVLTTVTLPVSVTARYVRYVSPPGSSGNIAELQAFGVPAVSSVPAAPASSTVSVPPVVVSPPVVTPNPLMLCGSPGTASATWTVPARNGTLFDVTRLVDVQADDCVWSTPGATAVTDPTTGVTGSPDGLITTTLVTVLYDELGTYPVTCTAKHPDGSATVFTTSVTVTAETRTRRYFSATGNAASAGDSPANALSYSSLPALAAKGGYRLTCDGLIPLVNAPGGCVTVGNDTEIEGVPDTTGTLPTATVPAGAVGFFVKAGASAVIRGLAFDAPTNATGIADKGTQAVASTGNTLVFGCEIRHGYKGFGQEGNGDLSVINCKQTVERGLYGQIASSFPTAGRFVCLFNDFRGGTTGEAISRVDRYCTAWAVARNAFSQSLAAWAGSPKPGFDGRCGSGVATDNVCTDCQISFNLSDVVPGIVVKALAYALIRLNTFVITNKQLATYANDVNVRHGVSHVTVRGNKPSGAFAKFVDGFAGLVGITIGNNP